MHHFLHSLNTLNSHKTNALALFFSVSTAKLQNLKAIHNAFGERKHVLDTAKLQNLKAIHNGYSSITFTIVTAKLQNLKAIHNTHDVMDVGARNCKVTKFESNSQL